MVFSAKTLGRLKHRFDLAFNLKDISYTSEEVANLIAGYDGLITGWGSPQLTASFFQRADRLRIVAHSAGSVKFMLSKEVIERYILPRRICVCNANKAIAHNVAEATLGLLIMASRRFVDHVSSIRDRLTWRDPGLPLDVSTINGSTIGIVSASAVGREVIRLLSPFDVRILVYDPYLQKKEAQGLNVEKTDLRRLFSVSDFVTIHAPLTSDTRHMINRKYLGLLKDGAILLNTSRGGLIDHNALLEECKTGRIMAVLDVTDPEPLPPDSPLRGMANVIITPHIAGLGLYGYHKIGEVILGALENYFAGRKVENAIDFTKYEIIA